VSAHRSAGTILRRLRFVRWPGVADTLLLVWLLYASFGHDRDLVRILAETSCCCRAAGCLPDETRRGTSACPPLG
jgi:hypothetical protein